MSDGISIDIGLGDLASRIVDFGTRTMLYVVKRALNDTAADVLKAEQDSIARVFDRPTPWVQGAFFVREASEANLVSSVEPKEFASKGVPAWKSLRAEVRGGVRRPKAFELLLQRKGVMRQGEHAVPAQGVALDAYGNIPGSTIVQILSQLESMRDPTQNITKRSRKRAIKKAGGRFFVMRNAKSPDGIYQRADKGIQAVMLFVRPSQYRKALPFYETSHGVARRQFPVHFWARFNRYGGRLGPPGL